MQDDPIKIKLKALGTKRLKLKYDEPLSKFAFKFNLRRYTKFASSSDEDEDDDKEDDEVGRCRFTASNPDLKAHLVSALDTQM